MSSSVPRSFLKRSPNSHKGTYGHLLVVAGSLGMTGAPVLAAQAALRSGAGLVTVAVPKTVYAIVARKLTEAMVFPLPAVKEGSITGSSFAKLKPLLKRADVVAVGPGLSRRAGVLALVRQLLGNCPQPLVIDADGIAALKGMRLLRRPSQAGGVVITPHPGEMARLLGTTTAKIEKDRRGIALKVAKRLKVVVLLKGNKTVIASPTGSLRINSTGNPGMATAGMGDLLTGMIGALLGAGLKPFEATVAGAYLHGLAGDRAARQVGQVSLVASDLLRAIPETLRNLSRKR